MRIRDFKPYRWYRRRGSSKWPIIVVDHRGWATAYWEDGRVRNWVPNMEEWAADDWRDATPSEERERLRQAEEETAKLLAELCPNRKRSEQNAGRQ